jgi:hypothetical protein
VPVKPGLLHRSTLWLDLSRRGKTLGYAALTLVMIGVLAWCLLYQSGQWPDTWSPTGRVAGGTILTVARFASVAAIVLLVVVAWNGYGWYVGREVIRLGSEDPAGGYLPQKDEPTRVRAPRAPPLEFAAPALRRPRGLRAIRGRHNVTRHPPLRIGYLRVFENHARVRAFANDAWREFGYVHLLRGATSVRPRELRQLRRDPKAQLVSDTKTLDLVLDQGLRRRWALARICFARCRPIPSGRGIGTAPTPASLPCATGRSGSRRSTTS